MLHGDPGEGSGNGTQARAGRHGARATVRVDVGARGDRQGQRRDLVMVRGLEQAANQRDAQERHQHGRRDLN
jgi:hypothetical protein